jgi:hypothetical protein
VEGREPSFDLLGEDKPVRASLVAALLTVGLLGSCTGDAPEESEPTKTASGTSAVTADPTPPPDDACYRLTLVELTEPTNDGDPVPCGRKHTAQTIHVGQLRLKADGQPLAVDSKRAQRQISKACPARMASYVGGEGEDRRLSRFRVVWFSPTLEESDAGARWFRCDLVAFGVGERLHSQRGRVRHQVLNSDAGLNRYGLCGTSAPGDPGFERVLCQLRHTWRAIATIEIEGGPAYPGPAAVREAGDSVCSDLVREAEDFALTYTYGWEWPTRKQWRAGQKYGYCWAKT